MAKQVSGGAPPLDPSLGPQEAEVGGISMGDLGVTDGVGPSDLPRLEPRAAALFIYHPERWGVIEGEVVPMLGRLPVIGGVGNVKVVDARRGKLSISQAVAEKAKRGWIPIPLDVDGPGTSYLHRPLPGVFLTRWDIPHAGSSIVTHDGPGYARWLRGLIRSGKIPAPKPYVLERLKARLTREVLELKDKVRTVPSAQVDLDRKISDLSAVERELGSAPLIPLAQRPSGLGDLTE